MTYSVFIRERNVSSKNCREYRKMQFMHKILCCEPEDSEVNGNEGTHQSCSFGCAVANLFPVKVVARIVQGCGVSSVYCLDMLYSVVIMLNHDHTVALYMFVIYLMMLSVGRALCELITG
jgi:hypothetical protein